MESSDLLTLMGGGGVVALLLRWVKASGWLAVIPDRQLVPGTHLRGVVTLALAVIAGFIVGYVQQGTIEAGVIAVSGALSTHSAVFGVTPLGQWVDATVPQILKRKR